MKFTITADGGARGNPGPAGSGAVVKDEHQKIVAEISRFLGHTTNNVAEYTALVAAFEALSTKLGPEQSREAIVNVFMDSKLIIEQMKGKWKVKHPNMKPLHARASTLAKNFKTVTFAHIPREENGEADALANEAMDRGSN
jgi:ribonuclease HI